MMKKAIGLAALLALAACGENSGWNPNYSAGPRVYGSLQDAPPYSAYKVKREAALKGQAPAPKTIPVALPVNAPTAQEIAGPNLWQIIQGQARRVTGTPAGVASAEGSAVLRRFALSTSHAPGTRVWPRSGGGQAMGCAGYATADAAQIAFLGRGGPQADPSGMDPDGDGYVCGWNPAPWRSQAGL